MIKKVNKKIKLLVYTAARSDFGILKEILNKLETDRKFDATLIIGPAHKTNIFGKTKNEIEENAFKKKIFLKLNYKRSESDNIIIYLSEILRETNNHLKKRKFDVAIILGDRYEMMAFALCCLNYKIPIAHICGGSHTLGSLDEIYRYSISKMANVHLVETNNHKQNLNKIGIKKNIYIVGAPALENLNPEKLKSLKNISKLESDFLKSKKYKILACFHPETDKNKEKNINYLNNFIKFLNNLDAKILFTYPNADEGFNDYINILKYKVDKKKIYLIPHLGINKYYYFLKKSNLLIGNSSSGIIESCSFNIPCINLGERQKGRFAPRNIIHSSYDLKFMKKSFRKVKDIKFLKMVKKLVNPYEKKDTSKNVLKILQKHFK